MIEIKKNQVMPRSQSTTKLKQSGFAGQGQTSFWNNPQNSQDILYQDEDAFNMSSKFQYSQRGIQNILSQRKIDGDDNDSNQEKNEEKIIFRDQKSVGGSMLIYDKINQRSRNQQIERQNSIKLQNNQQGQNTKDNKSIENNHATSTVFIDGNKTLLLQQNSMVMSENNIHSPKDDVHGTISMSIMSLQNQGTPANRSSQINMLSQQHSKSHFASILRAHRISASKSGIINHVAINDHGQYNNLTPKEGYKRMSSLQSQLSIFKKKKSIVEKISIQNIIGKVFIIQRFMRALKRSSLFYNFQNLKQMHYQIIGDKAHVDKEERDRMRKNKLMDSYAKYICQKINKIALSIKVFQPDNIWILIFYNVIILLLTISTAFSEMILSSFNNFNGINISTTGYEYFCKIASAIFFIEILVRFNTGTYREGVIIFSRDVIFKNYGRFQFFWVDIISAINLIGFMNYYVFSLIVFILRYVKIYRLSMDLNDHFRIWYRFPIGWILTKLFFMIITLAHFWGCQFHYIGRLEVEAGLSSWLKREEIVDEDCTISMITIGYGDIVPETTIEKCYVTFVAVLGSCFFSYIVNTIGSIFQEISNREAAFKQSKNNITDYMAKRNINQKLQLKVIKYLDYTHTRSGDGPLKGQLILNNIAKNLKEEVMLEYFGNILQNTNLFSKNFSPECLRGLSLKLKEIIYGPGEVIFHKGELDYKIFFIQSGEVSLFLEKDGGEIFELTKLNVILF